MPTEVEVAGEGIYEFPDDMGNDEIQSILRKQFPVAETPKPDFRHDELAKQTFQARLEGEQAKALTGLTEVAYNTAEALSPSGLMNQPFRAVGAQDPYQAGRPLVTLPKPEGTGFASGLGQLAMQTLEGFTTPEMLVTLPGAGASPVVRALFAGEMAKSIPEGIGAAGETLRDPEATTAQKVVAAGQPLISAAFVRQLAKTPEILMPAEFSRANIPISGTAVQSPRGALPPRVEPVAPIERVTPEQAAIAAERMSAPFEGKLPTKPTILASEKVEGATTFNPDAVQSKGRTAPVWDELATDDHFAFMEAIERKFGEPETPINNREDLRVFLKSLYEAAVSRTSAEKATDAPSLVKKITKADWKIAEYELKQRKGIETEPIPAPAKLDAPTVAQVSPEPIVSPVAETVKPAVEPPKPEVAPVTTESVYDASLKAFRSASKQFTQAQSDYRARIIGDEDFLAAKAKFKQAEEIADQAERAFIESKNDPPKPTIAPEAAKPVEPAVATVEVAVEKPWYQKAQEKVEGKESWQVTKQDYSDASASRVSGQSVKKTRKLAESVHKGYIRDAIRAGKPVPPEVLADYPDLKPTTKPVDTPVEAAGKGETVDQPAKPITQGPGEKLQALTAKLESGEKLTASEQKQYRKLRDEATGAKPEAAQAQVSAGVDAPKAGPGAAAPLDVAAESAAQSAGVRTAEYINRGSEAKDIKTQPDLSVPEADLKMSDPQVEARWNAAKISKPSFIQKGQEAVTASKNAMTRHFRFLDPKTDGVVTDLLRVHENDPLHAKFMASQVMRGITDGLKPKKYDVFSRVVILRDLVKYGEKFGQDLADIPFGYKSWDAVKTDLARFDALSEKFPDIKESLRRRDEFMGALRYDLVSRGLLSEKVKDFDEYFHHQVLQYMALKEPYASTGSMDVRTHGKGWQKGRTGSAKDYNTSYLESEFEVISQSFAQMATQDTLKSLKNAADISEQLKIAARDARESGSDVTWEQLIPGDHTIWQPQQGNHFYWANSITEKALDAYMKGAKQLTEADIKEVLAMGGPKEQWVIPKRLAKTLDDFKPPVDNAIEKGIGAGISQWKRWTLFNPMRNVIYELNNLSGDADIAFAVDPKIFKYAPEAAKEVAQFVRAKKGASKEMSDLVRLGVIDSGFSVQELPDLKGNQFFRALEGKTPSLTERYWENILDFNRWREGVLRLASYKRAMDLLQNGKKPYWTSKKAEMDALYKDPNITREQIAAKLAREAIGDYGNISYAGQWIRSKLIPFYSWMEINAPRYARLMQNAKYEGEGAAGRVAGIAGKKLLTQSAKLTARMAAFYFAANLWNRSLFPEEDRELNSTRNQFHVIIGRKGEDGVIPSLRLQGAFSDALSWFGAQDLIKDVNDVQGGLATPGEKAIEMGKAPVNKVAQGAWPIYKTLFEALVKKQTYPDIFNPRPIRDSKAHIARMLSLGSIYDYLAKHPQRPGTWSLKALATYTTDPGEAAYMTAKSIVSNKLKEMNVERPGAEPTEKSNALYYWKQSIRYKNPKLEEYWRTEYQRLGGKTQYLDTGLRNTSPYNGVSKANRGQFESLLSPAEKEIMQRADDWYRKTYIER